MNPQPFVKEANDRLGNKDEEIQRLG